VTSPGRILVHGHRGARAIYSENTVEGFLYAIEAGADAVEFDVAVTKDGVAVVTHDPHINPGICTGPRPGAAIHDLTLAELREYDCGSLVNRRFPRQRAVPGARIPTLSDVLSLAGRCAIQFDIEIKSFPDRPELTPPPEAFAQLVLDEIRGHRLESRVAVLSFDFRTLRAMHRLAPEIRLAALWEGEPRPFVETARSADARIASPMFPLVTREQVDAAHQAGLEVVPWTANTPEDWRKLVDAGVDGIITDDPAALIAYLTAEGRR
jgi:glycerophosphoryl diester phosphodiesterase